MKWIMKFLEWNDKYSVNVKEIDIQHQEIFKITNKLLNSMADGTGDEIVGDILQNLADYIVAHFRTEEYYFDKFNYPKSNSHKEEHQTFVLKVSEFKKSFEKGRKNLYLDVTNFILNWLMSHLLLSDKEYAKFFNEKGLR
jgi:hemerythrin